MNLIEEIEMMDPYMGFGMNLYAQTNPLLPKKLDVIPDHFSNYEIRKNYLLTGNKFNQGIGDSVSGTLKLFESVYNQRSEFISNKISGQFENSKGELIFFHGKLNLYLNSGSIEGQMIFSNGTGQYAGCSGNVKLSGNLEYGYLEIDCNGSMNLAK